MSWAMCVKAIENALNRLDGVSTANVNLAVEKVYITYNPWMTTITEMKKAIEGAGYQYLGMEGDEMEDTVKEKDLREKRNRIIVGIAVGVLLMVLMYLPIQFPFSLAI